MEFVYVESPYAGDVERNIRYARACVADCLQRGETPFASHLFYTQPGILRDEVAGERARGIEAGFAWAQVAHAKSVFYTDLGLSRGMQLGIERATYEGRPIEYRRLPGWKNSERAIRTETT